MMDKEEVLPREFQIKKNSGIVGWENSHPAASHGFTDKDEDCQHYHKGENTHHVSPNGSAHLYVWILLANKQTPKP